MSESVCVREREREGGNVCGRERERRESVCTLGSTMPSILAMAVAVAGWSPVIIFTMIPAVCRV